MTICQIIDSSSSRIHRFTYPLILTLVALGLWTRQVYASEELLKAADGYYRARNYSKAEEVYREVFINNKKGPLSERALFGVARAEHKLKRYAEARLNLQRFLSVFPQSGYVNEAFFLLAYISLSAQKFDEARYYFEKVTGPLKKKADIGRAEVSLKRDDLASADAVIKAMDRKELELNPRAQVVEASLLSRKGMNREAVAIISKVMDATLREEDLRVEKALIYFSASRFNDVEKLCKTILANPVSKSEKTRAQKVLAKVYELQGRVDDALSLYSEIVPYETDDSFRLTIAGLYDKKGDTGNALRYVSLLKDKSMRSSEIEKRLKQRIAARDAKAVEYLLRFSFSIDQDSPFIITAAHYLIDNGKKTEGTLLLRRAQRGAEKGEAALSIAETLISGGKYNEARKTLTPLLLENRYFAEATSLMAEIQIKEGDLDGAIAGLEKVNTYSKKSGITRKLADLYLEKGERNRALKYYAISADRGDAVAALKAGDLLFLAGNASKARGYYKQALRLKLSDEKDLQWAYYQYGKITRSKECLKKAADKGGVVGEAARILAGP